MGIVGRAVGLGGEVEVRVVSDDPTRFEPGSLVLAGEARRPLVVLRRRAHRDRVIVAFEEVRDRDAAEALRGVELVVAASRARTLESGEYWDHDLRGCEVVTTEGVRAGTVTDVLHGKANDVLVVDGRHLVPMTREVIRSVVAGERVVVEPLPGLFED